MNFNPEIFRALIEQSSDGFCVFDQNGKILLWNNALHSFTGISEEIALNKTIWEIENDLLFDPHPEKLLEIKAIYKNLILYLPENNSFKIDNVIERENQQKKYLYHSIYPIILEDIKFFGRISKDISEVMYLHKALEKYKFGFELKVDQQSEEILVNKDIYKVLFEQAADCIVLLNENKQIIEANDVFLNMFSCKKEDILGKLFENVLNLAEVEIYALRYDLLEKNQQVSTELPVIINKRQLDLELHAKRLLNGTYLFLLFNNSSKISEQQRIIDTVIETEERERKRFAEEVHDGLGPLLSSIKMYTKLLVNLKIEHKRDEIVSNLIEVIDEAINTSRQISNLLSPNVLEDFGLYVALKSFRDKILTNSSIEFSLPEETKFDGLSKKFQIVIYRVITELINNSLKYSYCKCISIHLHRVEETIYLIYKDDGIGFDIKQYMSSDEKKGFGLLNIKSRIQSLKGTVEFISAPETGMRVNIVLKEKI